MAPRRGTKAAAPMAPTPPTKIPPARPLTAGQERFAQEFVRTNNATEAYAIAYPNAKRTTAAANATRLMLKSPISTRVAALRAAAARSNAIDAEWVVGRLKAISDRCMIAEPVLGDDGEPTGVFTFDAAGANRSTELLGKSIGMFATRVDFRDLAKMTDAELLEEQRRLSQSGR